MVDTSSNPWLTMGMEITKRQAKEALGIKTDAELARFFIKPISRQAIHKIGEDEPLPYGRCFELLARKPELFVFSDESVIDS